VPSPPWHIRGVGPSKGGALHDRKDCLGFVRPYSPRRPSAARPHPIRTEGLGIRMAIPRGRTECASPRKLPLCLSQGLPSKPLCRRLAVYWRGGLRTPAREASLPPRERAIRPRGVRSPPMIMLCLGLSTSLACGRGDRVPSRKPPSASSPDFPR
jgi:hypothetical protein